MADLTPSPSSPAAPDVQPTFRSSLARTRDRGPLWQALGIASSARTAAVLIALVGLSSWLATYYERDFGPAAAQMAFYTAWWFQALFALITVAVIGAVAVRLPLRRNQRGFAIVHGGLLLLIIGFWLGADRLDGMLNAWPGQEAHRIEMASDELSVLDVGADQTWRARFDALTFAGYPSALRYLASPLWPVEDPGMHVLDHPLELASLPGGTSVWATRVVDTGSMEAGYLPAPGDPAAQPAVHVSLSARSPGAEAARDMGSLWMTADERSLETVGPCTISLARTAVPALVADFLSTTAEPSPHGRLILYAGGQRLEVVVDPARLPQTVATSDGTKVTIEQVLLRPAQRAGGDGLVDDPAGTTNPVLTLRLTTADGQVHHGYAAACSLLPAMPGLPEMLYRHPLLDSPEGKGLGAFVRLLAGPDGRLHLRSWTRSRGPGATATVGSEGWKGDLTSGPAMTLSMAVQHLPQAISGPQPLLMRADRKDRAVRWLEVEVRHGNAAARRWIARGDRAPVTVPGHGEVLVHYHRATYDLKVEHGFAVKLRHFSAGKDPGGMGNASYQSEVEVLTGSTTSAALITMNQPLRTNGATIYQTAFFPETGEDGRPTGREVSVFTVATDRGRVLKYLGSLLLVAGILVMYADRRSK